MIHSDNTRALARCLHFSFLVVQVINSRSRFDNFFELCKRFGHECSQKRVSEREQKKKGPFWLFCDKQRNLQELRE